MAEWQPAAGVEVEETVGEEGGEQERWWGKAVMGSH